ncbi:MAG: hypothetical protein ACXWC4_05055 [Telluria sp.]
MSAASQVGAVLQRYAERGVIKDYRALAGKNEQSHFDFDWLYRQPFSITVDGKRRRLVMADLLPGVERDSMMYRELKEFLKGRADTGVPEHRRVDPQLATVAPRLRDGVVSLELTLLEGDYEYGTRKLVNLAHETFLFLSEYWADYMWENFELNME